MHTRSLKTGASPIMSKLILAQVDPDGHLEYVRDLITCEECKHYLKSGEECQMISTRLHFYEANKKWTEDSFCSWAKKNDN